MDFRKLINVSVECVVFGMNESGLNVLLTKRILNMFDEKYPEIDDWILPGAAVLKSETLDESADRIFSETTGMYSTFKRQFRTLGNPQRIKNKKDLTWLRCRDVSSRVMSVAYYFLLPDGQFELKNDALDWFPIRNLPALGFDHDEIISRAYKTLQKEMLNEPLIFELLPDKFSLNELQFAYQAVQDVEMDNRNFRKKALGKTYIVALDEKRTGNSKRPASLYMFSKDVYEKTAKLSTLFNI